jgi:type II secretion system (T2SS) protein E
MSSNPPTEGTFFVDQPTGEQPAPPAPPAAPAPAPEPAAVPEPLVAAEPVAAPEADTAAEATDEAEPGSMRDVPLGTLIFRAGLLAEEQLEDALQDGMRTGKRLGEVLLERGWLHERDLGRLLAGQKGLPFVELSQVTPDPTAVPLIPEEKARLQNALAIAFEKGVPVVAVADPTNDLVLENLRRVIGCEPRLVVAAHGDLQKKINESYGAVEAAPITPAAAPPAEPPAAVTATAEPAAAPAPPPVEAPAPAAAPPVVQPMPVVEPPVQPADAPAEVPPLVAQPLAPPVAAEQLQQPAATPEPPPMVEASPVVAESPAPAPETPAPVIQPLSLQPALAPETAFSPAEQPPAPAEPPVTQPAPETPPVASEVPATPVAPPPVPAPQAEPAAAPPAAAEPVTEPSANGTAAEASVHFVILRLTEGEQLEIGSFGSSGEAHGYAQEVVRQITSAEGESTWPFFAGRFLRPATIVSLDVVAESSERWLGSSVRARWASE